MITKIIITTLLIVYGLLIYSLHEKLHNEALLKQKQEELNKQLYKELGYK